MKNTDTKTSPALPAGWTDRHTRVTRFALHMMSINAEAKRHSIAQGQPAPPGTDERLKQDSIDALAARDMLEALLEPAPAVKKEAASTKAHPVERFAANTWKNP